MIHKLMQLKICPGNSFEYSDDELFFVNKDDDLQPISVEETHTIIEFFTGFVKDKRLDRVRESLDEIMLL